MAKECGQLLEVFNKGSSVTYLFFEKSTLAGVQGTVSRRRNWKQKATTQVTAVAQGTEDGGFSWGAAGKNGGR